VVAKTTAILHFSMRVSALLATEQTLPAWSLQPVLVMNYTRLKQKRSKLFKLQVVCNFTQGAQKAQSQLNAQHLCSLPKLLNQQ